MDLSIQASAFHNVKCKHAAASDVLSCYFLQAICYSAFSPTAGINRDAMVRATNDSRATTRRKANIKEIACLQSSKMEVELRAN